MSEPAASMVEAHDFDAIDLGESLGIDRRVDDRKTISVHATVTVPGETGERVLHGHTLDLSRRGAGINVPFELAPGQQCMVELALETCGVTSKFHIPAQVRFCVPWGGVQFRAGMRFGKMDEATTALIEAVLK